MTSTETNDLKALEQELYGFLPEYEIRSADRYQIVNGISAHRYVFLKRRQYKSIVFSVMSSPINREHYKSNTCLLAFKISTRNYRYCVYALDFFFVPNPSKTIDYRCFTLQDRSHICVGSIGSSKMNSIKDMLERFSLVKFEGEVRIVTDNPRIRKLFASAIVSRELSK